MEHHIVQSRFGIFLRDLYSRAKVNGCTKSLRCRGQGIKPLASDPGDTTESLGEESSGVGINDEVCTLWLVLSVEDGMKDDSGKRDDVANKSQI